MPPKSAAAPRRSIGGFTGTVGKVVTRDVARNALSKESALDCEIDGMRQRDAQVLKLTNVNFGGWEEEKEIRVKNAFNRIIEHEWYDKLEGNLKAVELVHINAVREHYAMRRDKVKTPALLGGKKSNSMTALQWADNVNSIHDLKPSTNLRDHFMDMVKKQSAHRRKGQVAPNDVPH